MATFPCAVSCIPVACFIHSCLCLLISYPQLSPLPFPLCHGNHEIVLCICESVCFLIDTHFYFLDYTYE